MEGIALEYLPPTNKIRDKVSKEDFHSYISDDNENIPVTHMITWFVYFRSLLGYIFLFL